MHTYYKLCTEDGLPFVTTSAKRIIDACITQHYKQDEIQAVLDGRELFMYRHKWCYVTY